MPRRIRWLAAPLAVTLAAALLTTPASAAPNPPPDGSVPPGKPVSVTLLTGDTVEVAAAAPGRFAASVTPGPGRDGITFHTMEVDDRVLVLPSDVVPYVSTGVLDDRLFDVPGLIAQGYDDGSAAELPLIIRFRNDSGPAASSVLATGASEPLASINGAALAADKSDLGDLWSTVAGTDPVGPRAAGEPSLQAGVAGIWLDGRVEPALEHSTPQVGAPQAWDAGFDGTGVTIAVLDTGVDDTHPDLTGKVGAAENFTDSDSLADMFGHGTHVAAIAAGTGQASGGARRGVAPGATVLAGKVLNDFGFGLESWIIAGMEWAVAEGADVVNMSLGGGVTDGTDPLSAAVNRLSHETGTLFVISAGNAGAEYRIGSPGAASAALTVGAVDRDDELAGFSSRGPRWGDNALKPEITAPGVGIVAARADGTAMGAPVDDDYTAASGTSMAAPHVAGAAALVAQAYPETGGAALKDALVSTAAGHPELTVYEQGAGRVDAARAVAQGVYATGVVDFGLLEQPVKPVSATLRYANHTSADVTLDLSVTMSNIDRGTDASAAVDLGTSQVTVPAETTATVPVPLDVDQLEYGRHSGWITATGPDGIALRTALGTTLTAPVHTVTLRAVNLDGSPGGADMFALHGDDPRNDVLWWIPSGSSQVLEVEEGTYFLQALIPDFDPQFEQQTLITNPELEVTGDMEVVLDARTATPVRIETPLPAEQRDVLSYYTHRTMGSGRTVSHGVMHFSNVQQVNVTPTEPVAAGEFEFSSRWQLVAPMVTADVPGVSDPIDLNLLHQSPTFAGTRQFPLVFAGTGSDEELARAGVDGAVALMRASEDRWESEQVAAAAAAGAAGAIVVRPLDFPAWTVWRPVGEREPIPAFVTGPGTGDRLIDRATDSAGGARIRLDLTVSSPYLYDVMHVEPGRVPDEIVHRVSAANATKVTVGYADTGGFGWLKEQRFGWRPWQAYAWNDTQRVREAGTVREEWVSAGDTLWQHRVHHEYTWDDMNPLSGGMVEVPRTYDIGVPDASEWYTPLVRPAAVDGFVSDRSGDQLRLRVPEFVDGAGHYGFPSYSDQVEARLLRDGEEVAVLPDAWRNVTTVPGAASYRLELITERSSPEWRWSTRTETAWEFTSERPAADTPLPLLQVGYDIPADMTGTVSGDRPYLLGLSVRHQDGLPAPEVDQVSLQVSFDDGDSWQVVPVRSVGDNLAALVPPESGAVSLRVRAQAADGSAVTQTVIRAYGVR